MATATSPSPLAHCVTRRGHKAHGGAWQRALGRDPGYSGKAPTTSLRRARALALTVRGLPGARLGAQVHGRATRWLWAGVCGASGPGPWRPSSQEQGSRSSSWTATAGTQRVRNRQTEAGAVGDGQGTGWREGAAGPLWRTTRGQHPGCCGLAGGVPGVHLLSLSFHRCRKGGCSHSVWWV